MRGQKTGTKVDPALIERLEQKTKAIRADTVKMIHKAGEGHPGGSLSAADIVTALYFHFMRIDPEKPDWEDRDRFILSKGRPCHVWYSALTELGFYPRGALDTLRKLGSPFQGHPDMSMSPGVDMSAGSLGHGLSIGIGMALMGKLDKKDDTVYILLGDGELNEGQVWEAAMCTAKYHLDNLVAIVDYNRLQIDGPTDKVMPLDPLGDKWRAFNWRVFEIDGNDMTQVVEAIEAARKRRGLPSVIIANTLKGRGVSYMESQLDWHGGKVIDDSLLEIALKDIQGGEEGGEDPNEDSVWSGPRRAR
jgi:transketolase